MQPVPSAGKHATGTKRGKTCNRYQARENMQRVTSTGKHVTGAKREKTMVTGTKRGNTFNWF